MKPKPWSLEEWEALPSEGRNPAVEDRDRATVEALEAVTARLALRVGATTICPGRGHNEIEVSDPRTDWLAPCGRCEQCLDWAALRKARGE